MRHLLTLCVAAIVAAAHPMSARADVMEAARAIDELRLDEAHRALDGVQPSDEARFEAGLLAYHEGRYVEARAAMIESALLAVDGRAMDERLELLRIADATARIAGTWSRVASSDGRFEVHFTPLDAAIATHALAVLTSVDAALQRSLGVRHPGPIRLEILESTSDLARVSSLSIEAIETTGTIALCKWDRLMITSPRALVRGYPWADTVGHEFVHLVLARATADRAPVWVQEGYARSLERAWREGDSARFRLDARSASLLRDALATNSLIPFERMHPSIARLPSADQAALAFAQVSTLVDHVRAAHGSDALRRIVVLLREGVDARDAFARATGRTFESLESAWRAGVAAAPTAEAEEDEPLVFRHGEDTDDAAAVQLRVAREGLRLGDLLHVRGRLRAARYEYERAFAAAPEDPIVTTRLARAAYAAGDPARTATLLEGLRPRRPEHAPLLALLAAAYADLGRLSDAATTALESIWINPFDPEAHCAFARGSASADDPRVAASRSVCGH